MAPKTDDKLLREHGQSTEKEDRIVTATIHFLSSESYILYLADFRQRNNKLPSFISKHFLSFCSERFLLMILFKNCLLKGEWLTTINSVWAPYLPIYTYAEPTATISSELNAMAVSETTDKAFVYPPLEGLIYYSVILSQQIFHNRWANMYL